MPKTFADLERMVKDIERSVLSSKSTLKLGKQARDALYKRVKSGFGVNSDTAKKSKKKKLKGLSQGYIGQRERQGVEGKFGTPGQSNLTNTGQMLDAMDVKSKHGEFTITMPNSKRKKKGNEKKTLTNREVSEYVSENGRPFFSMTQSEKQNVIKTVEDLIRKSFNKFF